MLAHVEATENDVEGSIWQHKSLILGALAIFLYVGGEVAIGSFLVNYFSDTQIAGLSEADAGEMIAYYWGAAMVGRFIGAAAMNYIRPSLYLGFNALAAILMIVISMNSTGDVAMWSILAVGFLSLLCSQLFSPWRQRVLVHLRARALVLFVRRSWEARSCQFYKVLC